MSTAETLTDIAPQLAQEAIALRAELKYNCAQAVACALAEHVGIDRATMYRLSEGFGAGMGGHTETCGAISGAIMAISQVASAGIDAPGTTKGATYRIGHELLERFRSQNGSTACGELKGIGTGTGMLRTCEGCIEDATLLACELIDAQRAKQ